jgi:hypothetical protein
MGFIVNVIVTTLIQFDGILPLLTTRHYEEPHPTLSKGEGFKILF